MVASGLGVLDATFLEEDTRPRFQICGCVCLFSWQEKKKEYPVAFAFLGNLLWLYNLLLLIDP